MQRIGLTGGIAAGKSVASHRFAELGAVVIDSDRLARAAVAPGTVGLDAVISRFGPEVLAADGTLDRPALGHRVFADPAARQDLERLIHPEVRRLAAEQEAAAAAADPDAVVVHDIPLLIETGQADSFELVVVVHTPAAVRARRLVRDRALTEQQARARIEAQVSDEERLASADVVLDGSGTEAQLTEQVDQLWARLVAERAAQAG
jgi:dephospho-CoA kinase